MRGGGTPTGLVATGLRLGVLLRLRSVRLPGSVAVGEADETLNGGPPSVDLVFRWRVIQEQLSSRQSFCWSGGRQWRTVRGAGYARTSNYVRRSSIPSRRPCLARASTLACMLVLSAPRSTSSILVQQTYCTANTMTLSVLRLQRWAWNMHGRRGLRSLVLGPGSVMSSLVDVRSSGGVYPTTHLLRWWWDRRGRNSCRRSLLLRWHVDEDDEDLARVNAGSGSRNLDAPTWRAKDVGGNDTYGITRIPTKVAGCGIVRRAALVDSTEGIYPGSGHTDA